MEKKKIVVSNLMRAKNKQSFFALHQLQSKVRAVYPDVDIHFHILWDSGDNIDKFQNEKYWSDLIDSEIKTVYSYDKEFFDNYVKQFYYLDYTPRFRTWKAIYFILMAHYLRRVKLEEYYLIYDDDIIINDDFRHITELCIHQIPFGIVETMNPSCDKVLFQRLEGVYGPNFKKQYLERNPSGLGFNAGFQGIDLCMYDPYLSTDRLQTLLNLFDYRSVFDENGKEIWGMERFQIDTQQQSFFGLLNTAGSRKPIHILNTQEYYVVPNFGEHPKFGMLSPDDQPDGGWRANLASRITHFIGHTQGRGKPKQFLDYVDNYLKEKGYL